MQIIPDLSSLSGWFLYLTAVLAAFLVALWLGLIFWTYRDIRGRSRDRLIHVLAALLIALLNLPGIVVYLILRPPRTLDEEYQRTLEEESLLSGIEDRPACPGCAARTEPGWQICPTCHTRLRKPCTSCGKLLELSWKLCPHCATPVPGARAESTSGGLELPGA